jgi:hypothetical protein
MSKKLSRSYKTLYTKLLDDMINTLYSIEYSHDNRVDAVWRQEIETSIRKLKRKRRIIKN